MLDSAFVKLNVFPPGQRDFFQLPDYPHRFYLGVLPDFALEVIMEPTTLTAIGVLGVVAVAIAPLLTVQRMRRMNLPGSLRLVE